MSSVLAVSVVVATRNRAERLGTMLAGLRAQTVQRGEFEVIVVDDCSTDSTPGVLARERDRGDLRLRCARQASPAGPAAARNRGWRMASADRVAFTDDDCVPAPTWLRSLLAAFEGRPNAIVTGTTLPNPAEAEALGPYAKTVEITRPSPHYETCNVAYPRGLLERLGGFDEEYRTPAGEDSDLGARAAAAGGELVFAPDALVHHAVFGRRPLEALRDALLATDGVRAYKRNPALRRQLAYGLFYDRSHALLAAALCGAALAPRSPVGAALCLPYAHNLRNRRRAARARVRHTPFLVLFDAVQAVAAIRGAARYRTLVL